MAAISTAGNIVEKAWARAWARRKSAPARRPTTGASASQRPRQPRASRASMRKPQWGQKSEGEVMLLNLQLVPVRR